MKSVLLFFKTLVTMQVGKATTFWAHGDAQNPDPHLACLHRDLKDSDLVVAHKTLPCGSSVVVYNLRTNLATRAIVGDRGPRHAMVDLSRAVAKAIGSNGKETVVLISALTKR